LQKLAKVCDETGIRKVCPNGLAPSLKATLVWTERNEAVENGTKEYPDLILD